MIKRLLFLLGLMSLIVFAQTTYLNQIAFNSVKPDLALIFLVYVAFRYGNFEACIVGFLGGLMLDFISLSPLGFHSFIFVVVAFITSLGKDLVSTDSHLLHFLSLMGATFLKYLLATVIIAIFTISKSANPMMQSSMFIEIIYNMILAPLVFLIGNRLDQRFSRK